MFHHLWRGGVRFLLAPYFTDRKDWLQSSGVKPDYYYYLLIGRKLAHGPVFFLTVCSGGCQYFVLVGRMFKYINFLPRTNCSLALYNPQKENVVWIWGRYLRIHIRNSVGFIAGIFKQSMGARNRVGIGLSYRPARLHSLAELVPWNRFLGSLKV